MIYCFDIDGTLCTNTDGAYEMARAWPDVITRINALYDAGHRIILYTARGTTTGIDWRARTEAQLSAWGVRYHDLVFGKPTADVYVDDKAVNADVWRREGIAGGSEKAFLDAQESPSIFRRPEYLDVTYSPARAARGGYPWRLAEWLLRHVYRGTGRLLDLGCGRGEHLAAFAHFGCDVAGVDISPRAVELAAGYRVAVADLEREPLPFAPGFDYVFSKSVVEHMRNPSALFARALEALRPGGVAAIMTPSWEHTYWGPFYIDHTHVTPFTAPALADALEIAGFTSVRVSYFYQLPFLWRYPMLTPLVRMVAAVPLPYRPYRQAAWPEPVNTLIRFAKEVMLLGVAQKPGPRQ